MVGEIDFKSPLYFVLVHTIQTQYRACKKLPSACPEYMDLGDKRLHVGILDV